MEWEVSERANDRVIKVEMKLMEEVEFINQRVENGVVLWINCFIISQVI